jgi:hypothetical protein
MKQSKTLIDTTQTTLWISEMYKMIREEQDKFDQRIEEPKNLKLIVDFESTDIDVPENQMEIPVIKYKQKRILKKNEEVDLRNRKKVSKDLF